MKIALAQLNYHIGNFPSNVSKIISHIERAKDEGADLVVFSELAISGYPPRDFLEFSEFIDTCEIHLQEIAAKCVGIAAIVGSPVRNQTGMGKKLFNAACFLNEGKIEFIQNKTLLPNYDVFDEYRYFEPNHSYNLVEYKGKKLALTICEDIWDVGQVKMYDKSPTDELSKLDPDIFINISASPYSKGHYQERCSMLKMNARRFGKPFIYVNHSGAQTELIFDGRSMVCNASASIVKTMKAFDEDFWIFDMYKKHNTNQLDIDDREDVLNAWSRVSRIISEKAISKRPSLAFREELILH